MILFYDTETTAKYDYKRKPEDPCQPWLVQYAGKLVDPDSMQLVRAYSTVVTPGIPIPLEATRIHGISTDYARKHGADPEEVAAWHDSLLDQASLAVCHNISFDRRIMDTVSARLNNHLPSSKNVPEYCTMKNGIDICKLLPKMYGRYKWPKLEELVWALFREKFKGHDALADVDACARCYFKMVGNQKPEPKPEPERTITVYSSTCPLCAAPNTAADSLPAHVGAKYQCGCEVGHDLKVIVPCAAGTPKT